MEELQAVALLRQMIFIYSTSEMEIKLPNG